MANLTREPFDIGRKFVWRRNGSTGGRHYKRGDAFNWGRLSVSKRRVRLLYEAGWIGYANGAAAPRPDAKAEAKAAAEQAAREAEEAEAKAKAEAEAAAAEAAKSEKGAEEE